MTRLPLISHLLEGLAKVGPVPIPNSRGTLLSMSYQLFSKT